MTGSLFGFIWFVILWVIVILEALMLFAVGARFERETGNSYYGNLGAIMAVLYFIIAVILRFVINSDIIFVLASIGLEGVFSVMLRSSVKRREGN